MFVIIIFHVDSIHGFYEYLSGFRTISEIRMSTIRPQQLLVCLPFKCVLLYTWCAAKEMSFSAITLENFRKSEN